jgi:hypothetical protein
MNPDVDSTKDQLVLFASVDPSGVAPRQTGPAPSIYPHVQLGHVQRRRAALKSRLRSGIGPFICEAHQLSSQRNTPSRKALSRVLLVDSDQPCWQSLYPEIRYEEITGELPSYEFSDHNAEICFVKLHKAKNLKKEVYFERGALLHRTLQWPKRAFRLKFRYPVVAFIEFSATLS